MATRNISVSELRGDVTPTTNQKNTTRKNSDITNFVRTTLGQGTMLGFGDEIEAGLRSAFSDQKYSDVYKEINDELKQFRKDRPVLSVASELAGSLPGGALGIGKTLLKTAIKSGVVGGAYGLGAADTSEAETLGEGATKRIKNAVQSTVLSAGIGAGASKLFKTSKEAKKLLDKGVELSPAQTIDGVMGTGLKKIEEALTSIPILGTRSILQNVKKTFNIAVANEIGQPIGIVIPKNTPIKKISRVLSLKIKKSLDDSASKLVIKSPDELIDSIIIGIKNSKADSKIVNREIKKFNDVFMRNIKISKDGFIKGSNVQALDEHFIKMAKEFKNSDNYDLRLISDVFSKGTDDLSALIKTGSGDDAFKFYKATKNAWKNLQVFNKASLGRDGFEPNQLIRANINKDPTQGKMGSILGKGQLQDIAETGQSVIGKTVPDSGTGTRLLVGGGLLGAGSFDPVAGGLGAMGLLAYKNPFIRNALIGGKGIVKASPYASTSISERFGLK